MSPALAGGLSVYTCAGRPHECGAFDHCEQWRPAVLGVENTSSRPAGPPLSNAGTGRTGGAGLLDRRYWASVLEPSSSRFRVRLGSTRMPGPIVVETATFRM